MVLAGRHKPPCKVQSTLTLVKKQPQGTRQAPALTYQVPIFHLRDSGDRKCLALRSCQLSLLSDPTHTGHKTSLHWAPCNSVHFCLPRA